MARRGMKAAEARNPIQCLELPEIHGPASLAGTLAVITSSLEIGSIVTLAGYASGRPRIDSGEQGTYPMKHTLVAAAAALVLATGTAAAQERAKFEFWHGLTGDLGGVVDQVCKRFNELQKDYEVVLHVAGLL